MAMIGMHSWISSRVEMAIHWLFPKQVGNLGQLTDVEIANLFIGVKQVQDRLSKVFDTTDFTVCIHDGPLAGQEVPHVHVHVIPRTLGDGGLTLMAMWPSTEHNGEIDHEHLSNIAGKLREVVL